MRIGIDARLLNESGVGRYIRNLVKHLGRLDAGNEYILFLRRPQFGNVKFQMSNFKCQKVLADIRWHTLEEQILFPKILEKEELDLVHFPYFSVPVFYKGPFVITVHDLTITHFPTGKASTLPYPAYFLKHLGYQFVLNRAIKKAKKIIVPSQATKKEILDHFGVSEEKIAVTYEGTSLGKRKRRPPKNFTLGLECPYFLYVGNAYPHKNLERLLQAFLKLKIKIKKSKIEELRLVLVGKEDFFYKKLKKRVKEMGLSNKVIFYGEANDQELNGLYQNAVALVLPSLMEGFGLPALEAMSCGCLVLASDIPALRELCGEVAIYFNPLNSNDITEKMSAVFVHQTAVQYKSKVEAGLKRAKTFSWQKMAEETLGVYNSLIGSNNNQINSSGD